jgi:hypothetical protein
VRQLREFWHAVSFREASPRASFPHQLRHYFTEMLLAPWNHVRGRAFRGRVSRSGALRRCIDLLSDSLTKIVTEASNLVPPVKLAEIS